MISLPSLPLLLVLCSAAGIAAVRQDPAPLGSSEPKPVLRVFLLAGQSNMEGHAVVDLDDERDYNGGRGNLVRVLADPVAGPRWRALRAADGSWATRDDVFVSYRTEDEQKAGALSVGYAVYSDRHHFGPELGIGDVLGDRFDEPVLLVKTAWGGKSLAKDFRPPSTGGETGPCYARMLEELRAAVAGIPAAFPELARLAPRIDGVFWFQGWNDGCDDAAAAEYEENLVHLIGDVCTALGDASLPFVVGETGNMDNPVLRAAQKDACARPEVAAHARFVATSAFRRKPEDSPNPGHGHHWFGNAESYLLVGDALGRAMLALVDAREPEPAPSHVVAPAPAPLPPAVDLRPALDALGLAPRPQGARGTCSIFTTCSAIEFAAAKRSEHAERLSPEFLNWAASQAAGRPSDGNFFHNALAGFEQRGICPEADLPYRAAYDPALTPEPKALAAAEALREKFASGLAVHWIVPWVPDRFGLSAEQLAEVRRVLACGDPVAAGSAHSRLLVGYRDDPSLPGGGAFLTLDSALARYDEVTYEFVRRDVADVFWIEARP